MITNEGLFENGQLDVNNIISAMNAIFTCTEWLTGKIIDNVPYQIHALHLKSKSQQKQKDSAKSQFGVD